MSKPDGGYAFPLPISVGPSGDVYHAAAWAEGGMSLRDWFAGQVLNSGLLKVEGLPDHELFALFGKNRTEITREEIAAAKAYRMADAMLAERSKL